MVGESEKRGREEEKTLWESVTLEEIINEIGVRKFNRETSVLFCIENNVKTSEDINFQLFFY